MRENKLDWRLNMLRRKRRKKRKRMLKEMLMQTEMLRVRVMLKLRVMLELMMSMVMKKMMGVVVGFKSKMYTISANFNNLLNVTRS
jgi:CRISPR/Cas system CMR-associated protein Cmr3 (group 5 of RAMP superfamily)